jgi:hypothetical protein
MELLTQSAAIPAHSIMQARYGTADITVTFWSAALLCGFQFGFLKACNS